MEKKSGKQWVEWAKTNAPNSKSLSSLSPVFKSNLEDFIEALEDADATVTVQAARRSAKRAYLFHWCWLISLGKCKPSEATAMDGVDIQWDHGDLAESIKGAKEMVEGFGLAVPPKSNVAPALHSNHIAGKAVDIDIKWNGKLKVALKNGRKVLVNYKRDVNNNLGLIAVGKTYGVIKHRHDAPHWSVNGR